MCHHILLVNFVGQFYKARTALVLFLCVVKHHFKTATVTNAISKISAQAGYRICIDAVKNVKVLLCAMVFG